MRTKQSILLLALVAGCSSSDEPTPDSDTPEAERPVFIDEPLLPNPALDDALDAASEWQWSHNPRPPFVDDESPIDGFEGVDDALLDEAPMATDGDVEKGVTPIVWGWAVNGPPQMQDGNTTGEYESGFQDHCVQFGLACDNQPHAQALDTNYTGGTAADFADELQGRCGRFDSTVDNAWKPCIVPEGKPSADFSGKRWTWAYDAASCGLQPPQFPYRDLLLNGFRRALGRYANGGYVFTETTTPSTAQLVLYCSFGEIPAGKIAIGYPQGNITLRYAADHIFDETCEDGVPAHLGLHAYHFADMYYTYKKGRIGINWLDFWNWIDGCAGDSTAKTERVATIMMHEIGHVFGFAHAQLPSGLNFMYASKTCAWARNAGENGFGYRYMNALFGWDMRTNTPLAIEDYDISCYSPTGGGETPHD